jgi:hypothetical protein
MKDFLKIHKARENSRLFLNVGPYYIMDHHRNIVVNSKLPTREAAKGALLSRRIWIQMHDTIVKLSGKGELLGE